LWSLLIEWLQRGYFVVNFGDLHFQIQKTNVTPYTPTTILPE
jgi:hypothetical protein